MLEQGTAHVWWARLRDYEPGLEALLSPVERHRLETYAFADDRQRFVLGCVVTRLALSTYLEAPPDTLTLDRSCSVCGRPHGKVRIEGAPLELSVTHGGDLIGVAFLRDVAIGLDIEPLIGRDVGRLAARTLSAPELDAFGRVDERDRERTFLRSWTCKEAVIKCVGTAGRPTYAAIDTSGPDRPALVRTWSGRPGTVAQVLNIDTDPGYEAALAVATDAAVTVRGGSAGKLLAGLPVSEPATEVHEQR